MPIRRMKVAVPSLPLPRLQGYAFAVAVSMLAWFLSITSDILVGPPLPALPFIMAIVLAAGALLNAFPCSSR